MKKSSRILLFVFSFIFIYTSHVNAMEINLAADINISTEYHNCTKYADRIRKYTERFINSETDSQKTYCVKKVNKNKKKLKKCEKDNKNAIKNKHISLGGWQVGAGFSF